MIAGEHSSSTAARADRLLREAADGRHESLGPLLESYRNYLTLLATSQLDDRLRVKVSASDLVQETMLHAFRDFDQFGGSNERQLLAWLRQILINRLHTFVQQHVLAKKRSMRREVSLEQMGVALGRSTNNLQAGWFLADSDPSPSARAAQRETSVTLANHLSEMPAAYREVIVLRNLRGCSFPEVAEKMQRSNGAVRMLWLRAIAELQQRMNGGDAPLQPPSPGESA